MKHVCLILLVVLLMGCTHVSPPSVSGEDSTLVALLDQLDTRQGGEDHETCYQLYAKLSAEYEKKNLTELQKDYVQRMLDEADAISIYNKEYGRKLAAEAHQRLATTYMVEGRTDSAAYEAHQVLQTAPRDTVDFRAQTLVLLAQICLMEDQADSASHYLDKAAAIYPQVRQTDLYRMTHAYTLYNQYEQEELRELLPDYINTGDIHCRAELTRLLVGILADEEQWKEAYENAAYLVDLTEQIAAEEASASTTRIHALQHERQMETLRANQANLHLRYMLVIIGVLLLLLAACVAIILYRRRARIAHDRELEAMRLSELAQANENVVREENIKLQQLYYEHLYAIILPILNANRSKNGHIDLQEPAWELIERNTDMVLPGFSSRLRRQHPTLSTEDVRFCCLLMMRVPNAVLADVYGIAPSSVAMRKQRMKKKLDSDVQDQTIENYLNQYLI